MTSRTRAVLLALVVLLGGCTAPGAVGEAPTGPPSSPEPPTNAPSDVPPPVAIDWAARPAGVELGDGWSVRGCDGDAPLLCVARDDLDVGIVELLVSPADPSRFPDAMATELQLLDQAEAILQAHVPDRVAGCPDGYTVEADELSIVSVAGRAGARYGFTVTDVAARPVERVIGHLTVVDGQLVLLVANALEHGACVRDDEYTGFTAAHLAAFAPHLARIAAGSIVLPAR